jgi:nitrogenase-associated protein
LRRYEVIFPLGVPIGEIMAEILFYEKPGCINGEKQKTILEKAGNSVKCINILTFAWSASALLPFVAGREPIEIMNYTAPAIKNGEIKPDQLNFNEALSLMINNPILIKRPLIHVDGHNIQGFTSTALKPYLGDWDNSEDVITCPKLQTKPCDNI